MSRFQSFLWFVTILLSAGFMLAYGWAEGHWTGRWHPSNLSHLAAEKLKSVPMSVGDWQSRDEEFNESQLALGELDGYLYRTYLHRTTGDRVQVLIVCGRAGPVSLHTPDVCYRGMGFIPLTKPGRKTLTEGANVEEKSVCWGADFQKTTPLGRDLLRIGWTWLAAGRWQAVDQPRFEFATEPVLYKAYFIHPLLKDDATWEDDSILRLAKDLLPMLTEHLAISDAEVGQQQ